MSLASDSELAVSPEHTDRPIYQAPKKADLQTGKTEFKMGTWGHPQRSKATKGLQGWNHGKYNFV